MHVTIKVSHAHIGEILFKSKKGNACKWHIHRNLRYERNISYGRSMVAPHCHFVIKEVHFALGITGISDERNSLCYRGDKRAVVSEQADTAIIAPVMIMAELRRSR